MKSIVEEASSVMKAIEKGWVQAGKPQEFSIKVFEVEQKNFLGMTTKSAKIAIFYGEKIPAKSERGEQRREHHRESRPQQQRPTQSRPAQQHQQQQPVSASAEARQPKVQKERKEIRDVWAPELVDSVQNWLTQTLQHMNLGSKKFTVETKNYYLKISFEQSVLEDSEREKTLFRSFAHLIMQSLRNKFKKGFRGYKIVLNSTGK